MLEGIVDTAELGTAVMEGLEDMTVRKILAALIAAVVCLIFTKFLMVFVDRAIGRTHMEMPIKKLVRGLLRSILYFVAAIVVLSILGIPVTSLVAVLSVMGLALSLALQNFLANVAGGVQILASQPFKVGDWVEIDGCSGLVMDVGLFYTKLNSIDTKRIQLPNSMVMSGHIINFTAESERRLDLKLSVSYENDPALVLKTLNDMITGHPLVLADKPPFIHVMAYNESSIQYVARAWCKTEDYWTVYFDLLDSLRSEFSKAGIKFTYPHINVHMAEQGSAPPLFKP